MQLFPTEEILSESVPGSRKLVLTTHRIRFQTKVWGNEQIISIMLEQLCSCTIIRKTQPVFLFIAVLGFVGGVLVMVGTGNANALFFGFVMGIIFLVLYAATWREVLELASAGAVIRMNIGEIGFQSVKELIDRIEEAKNARYLLLESS